MVQSGNFQPKIQLCEEESPIADWTRFREREMSFVVLVSVLKVLQIPTVLPMGCEPGVKGFEV